MRRIFGPIGLLALLASLPGCGGGNTNSLPPDVGSPGYAKASADKMKSMYGVMKPEKGGQMSASDRMKAMYGH